MLDVERTTTEGAEHPEAVGTRVATQYSSFILCDVLRFERSGCSEVLLNAALQHELCVFLASCVLYEHEGTVFDLTWSPAVTADWSSAEVGCQR